MKTPRLAVFELVGTVLDKCAKSSTCAAKNAFNSIIEPKISTYELGSIIYSKYYLPCTEINDDFKHALKYFREQQIKDAGITDLDDMPFQVMKKRLFETGNGMCLYANGLNCIDDIVEQSYYNPDEIVKIGGTVEDLIEAKKRGLWTIGVVSSSPHMSTTKLIKNEDNYKDNLKKVKMEAISELFRKAQADVIINDLYEIEPAMEFLKGKIMAK